VIHISHAQNSTRASFIDQLHALCGWSRDQRRTLLWIDRDRSGLTLQESIKRRLEVHELSYELGYKMPMVNAELMSLKALAEGLS